MESRLVTMPPISAPTITLVGDADGVTQMAERMPAMLIESLREMLSTALRN
jgi:hypothetical protein